MNPDDDDAVINQLKHPRISLDVLPKLGVDFVRSLENRRVQYDGRPNVDLQTFAEDELVRKEYKELRCEMPGTPRSTFLMVFSPDGTKVASTHGNHNIYVTDLKRGKNIKTLIGHPRTPWCIAFHPTCNELVASGCLGGQVRIWDLSGGSEVWTAGSQTVIASIAFHPNDRVLVIATYNELHFWDWSKPQPFKHTTTCNTKEKVRYVAFDKLGHKLITGIANTPQSRWERSRASTTQNRWDRPQQLIQISTTRSLSPSPYRRRITPRLVGNYTTYAPQPISTTTPVSDRISSTNGDRVPLSSVPERERRITACYRNLVHEYELLVHRYLQVYRPPTTIDRGTDPMEMDQQTDQTPGPSTSGFQRPSPTESQSATPARPIPPSPISDTAQQQKSMPFSQLLVNEGASTSAASTRPQLQQIGSETSPRRRLIMRTTSGVQTSTDSPSEPTSGSSRPSDKINFKMRIKCLPRRRSLNTAASETDNNLKNLKAKLSQMQKNLSQSCSKQITNMAPKIAEFKKRNPAEPQDPQQSTSFTNTPEPIASTSTSQEPQPSQSRTIRDPWHLPLKRLHPGFIKKTAKHTRKPVLDTSSDNSSSEDEDIAKKRLYCPVSTASCPSESSFTPRVPAFEHPEPQPITCNHRSSPWRSSLERLVSLTDLVANNGNIEQSSVGICDRCGGNIESDESTNNNTRPILFKASQTAASSAAVESQSELPSTSSSQEAGTVNSFQADSTQPCARTLMNTDTRTTNSTVYTPSSSLRRRRSNSYVPSPSSTRSTIDSLTRGSRIYSLVPDEVINYSERVNAEDDLNESVPPVNEFHPFDPPPEFPSINPENIGIGNMYSNIVQDLESSLNNVTNIRASNRPGETSDMLSSFSERLESIMHQSDSILRNLRHTMDLLPPNSEPIETRRVSLRGSPALQLSSPRNIESDSPRFLFNDPSFYVRDHSQNNTTERNGSATRSDFGEPFSGQNQHEELDSNRSAIASDHTYPRNPESPRTLPPSTDNLTPLMTSLHLTISHIQRQARLLRRQVESIERIDRAMLEVAQLQMIRQMFGDIRRHLSNLSSSDNRSTGVSSVRQMMAGTRISDSSPCDSPAEEEVADNRTSENNSTSLRSEDPSPSSSTADNLPSSSVESTRPRVPTRKSFPPSRLLHIQRQNRRFSVVNFVPRRYNTTRDRLMRHRVYFRTFSTRPNPAWMNNVGRLFESDRGAYDGYSLLSMTRRLEQLLTDHIRLMGVPADLHPPEPMPSLNDSREDTIIRRLNACRATLDRLNGYTSTSPPARPGISCVTPDGISRFHARDTLSVILEVFTRFFDENTGTVSQSLRSKIRNVIDLSFLLSDILLLHIVDSIPPPTGMNLDPERESLSTRIDHMCTRMLRSRFGQSHNLTRSLRLMRLTAHYASRALGQTYNMRRNAIFSSGNSSRRELLGQINSTLHSIHRNRGMSYTPIDIPSSNSDPLTSEIPVREWYRTINALVSRYSAVSQQVLNLSTSSNSGRLSDAPRSSTLSEDTTVSDDNDGYEPDWFNNNVPTDRRQPLYRTNNVNLLSNEEAAPVTSPSRAWNVPTVQINDIPISESNSTWHSRITQHRYRLSELRSNPTGGLFRPRFLHPLYAGVNPFDADLDDPQREQMYDGDMILTVTPNHRIQAWDISSGDIPDISNAMKNLVVAECKIHNDASVDISSDGTILVTLLPSGGYLNVTNRLGVYSLRWETLGQCLYQTSFEQNAVSVSLSPLSRHLVVGLASRRVSIIPNDKWTMARIFLLNQNEMAYGSRLPVLRELEQNRDTNYMSLNCIRWLPISGQGLIYATNTGQLRILT